MKLIEITMVKKKELVDISSISKNKFYSAQNGHDFLFSKKKIAYQRHTLDFEVLYIKPMKCSGAIFNS